MTGWVVSASADNLNGLVAENGLLVPSIAGGGGVNSCVIMKPGGKAEKKANEKEIKENDTIIRYDKTLRPSNRLYRMENRKQKKNEEEEGEKVKIENVA